MLSVVDDDDAAKCRSSQSRELTGSDPQDDHESPDEPLLREERVSMVTTALQQLSDEHRTILVMREMQDLAYEDIAEILIST